MKPSLRTASILLAWLPLTTHAQTSRPAAVTFPTFGVAVSPPAGFVPIPEGDAGHVARWAKLSAGHVDQFVALEIEPRNGRTLDGRAKEIVDALHTQLPSIPSTLDNLPAVKIRGDQPQQRLYPAEVVVAAKGEFFYLLTLFVTPGNAPAGELQSMQETFHFLEPESPVRHLEPRAEPFPVLGRFLMNVPNAMRPMRPERPDQQLQLILYNYQAARPVCFTYAELIPTRAPSEGEGLLKLCQGVSANLQQKLGLSDAPGWRVVSGRPLRAISQSFESKKSPAQGGLPEGIRSRYAVVAAGDSVVMLTFTLTPQADADLQAYDKAIDAIVSSIAPLPTAAR